jgi:predicted metal-dependent hydrolase
MKEFIFGTFIYEYQLIKQDRRTLSLTVSPDLRIIVKCPFKAESERIEAFLQKKWFWLEKQLSFFKKYQRKSYEKEYVSGEGYLYLGRQYKLVVRKGRENSVSLTRGQLLVTSTKAVADGKHNKKLVEKWFVEKVEHIFKDRFNMILNKFSYREPPVLSIREMKKRWGSFLGESRILLNPKLIHVSKECIDYVITHELCHIKYRNHDKNFFKFLKHKYPRWEQVKEKLELIGSTLFNNI